MKTTVTIDDDLLEAAKVLAAQRKTSVGRVLSELIRKGLTAEARIASSEGGFPVFSIPADARPITLETVKQAEDDV